MDTSTMPITPAHQRLISETVQITVHRTRELLKTTGFPTPLATTPEQLNGCDLAKNLRMIARYAEGYDLGEGDIRPIVDLVYRVIFPTPLQGHGYQVPAKFHETALGEMIHQALCRHYPRGQRMSVGEVCKELDVTRQTVHDWAEDAVLSSVYDHGKLTFWRKQVQDLQQKRLKRREA